MDLNALVLGVIGLVALIAKFTDFLRVVTNLPGSLSAVLTQLTAWGAGLAGVFLYSASDFGPTITIGGMLLSDIDGPAKVILGLALGSAASLAVDFKQAFDNNDTAAKPPLVG